MFVSLMDTNNLSNFLLPSVIPTTADVEYSLSFINQSQPYKLESAGYESSVLVDTSSFNLETPVNGVLTADVGLFCMAYTSDVPVLLFKYVEIVIRMNDE